MDFHGPFLTVITNEYESKKEKERKKERKERRRNKGGQN